MEQNKNNKIQHMLKIKPTTTTNINDNLDTQCKKKRKEKKQQLWSIKTVDKTKFTIKISITYFFFLQV